jgi:hypothetical protein
MSRVVLLLFGCSGVALFYCIALLNSVQKYGYLIFCKYHFRIKKEIKRRSRFAHNREINLLYCNIATAKRIW